MKHFIFNFNSLVSSINVPSMNDKRLYIEECIKKALSDIGMPIKSNDYLLYGVNRELHCNVYPLIHVYILKRLLGVPTAEKVNLIHLDNLRFKFIVIE